MWPISLDQRFHFENFVVGQANRLAAAAGRRVAETPGSAYNPLFIYSGSGLGKTHLLNSIGHHARRLHPNLNIVYDTLAHFLGDALDLIQAGKRDELRANVEQIGFLLLDDVQFLAERRALQDELLRAWDVILSRGGQVVLASDRPPSEINELDTRLLSRFSGGLIADIGLPDYETRVAIVNRKATEQGQTLGSGVAETLAKQSFSNVRELQGSLNKLFAIQDLDGRKVSVAEIAALFAPRRTDEFAGFLDELTGTVSEVITHSLVEARIAEAMLHWQAEGYSTRRLEAALSAPPAENELENFILQFERDIERLKEIEREITSLQPDAPDSARADLFRTPDRLADAEELLENVRERCRPLPPPPAGRSFAGLSLPADSFALRTARAVSERPGERYNPFLVHGAEGTGKTTLLAALGNEIAARNPDKPVAFLNGRNFAAELISAIERNCVNSWRDRYRRAAAFVLDDIEGLIGTERAQEELFHLFDELRRNGTQLAFGSAVRPAELTALDDRLRTRLESGLVVAIGERSSDGSAVVDPAAHKREWFSATDSAAAGESDVDDWFESREKVLWLWPYAEDWLVEELD